MKYSDVFHDTTHLFDYRSLFNFQCCYLTARGNPIQDFEQMVNESYEINCPKTARMIIKMKCLKTQLLN